MGSTRVNPGDGNGRGKGKRGERKRGGVKDQDLGQRRDGGDLGPGGRERDPDQDLGPERDLLTPEEDLALGRDTRNTKNTERGQEADHNLEQDTINHSENQHYDVVFCVLKDNNSLQSYFLSLNECEI